MKERNGLIVVVAAIGAIVVLPPLAAWMLGTFTAVKAESIISVTGPAVSAIAAIAGAYFGINLGSEGRDTAETKKDDATEKAAKAREEAAAAKAVAIASADKQTTADEIERAITAALRVEK